jgi:hypothetical protein
MGDQKYDFADAVRAAAERSVIKLLADGSWLQPDYNNRVKVPATFMDEVWRLVDKDRVKRCLAERIEQELADRIVNAMAAEMATDIKQILSVKERREALRAVAREHLDAITRIRPEAPHA